jgi:hypothetical protein
VCLAREGVQHQCVPKAGNPRLDIEGEQHGPRPYPRPASTTNGGSLDINSWRSLILVILGVHLSINDFLGKLLSTSSIHCCPTSQKWLTGGRLMAV